MFTDNLEKILKERNLSMNKLAKETGISQASTDRWKKGSSPGIDKLIVICNYLHVSADYLLDLNEIEPPPYINQEERELINNYRLCSNELKEIIYNNAQSGAEKTKSKETSFNSNVG